MKRQSVKSEIRNKLATKPKWVSFIFWSFVTLVAAAIIALSGAWLSFVFVIVPGIFAWTSFRGGDLSGQNNEGMDVSKTFETVTEPEHWSMPGNIHHHRYQQQFQTPPD